MPQKAVKAFLWDYIGLFLRNGGSFIIGVFLARLLSPRDYGIVSLMGFFVGISEVIMTMGFSSALIVKKDVEEIHYNSVFWLNLALGCSLYILFFVLSPVFARFYGEPILEKVIKITSIAFIFNSMNLVQTVKLTKKINFKSQTKAQIIALIVSGTSAILMAINGFGLWSLVYYSLLSSFIYTCSLYFFEQWLPKLIFSWNAVRELWKYASNMFASGMLHQVFGKLDVLFIGKFLPVAILGNYNRAVSFNTLINRFTSESIGKVSFPYLITKNNNAEIISLNSKVLGIISMAIFGITGLIYLNADFIIITLFSAKWMASIPILKIIILSAFSNPINVQILSVIKAKGKSDIFLKLEIFRKIIYVITFLTGFWIGTNSGIEFGGLYGIMYGILTFSILSTMLSIYYAGRVLEQKSWYQFQIIIKYALLAFIPAILIIFLFNNLPEQGLLLSFLIKTIIFSLFYLASLLFFKTQAIADLKVILYQFRNRK